MINDVHDRERLATDIASDLVFSVDLHNNFGGLFHQPIRALRTLVVISFAAKFTEKLGAIAVAAFHWIIYNLMAFAAEEVFIQSVDWRIAQPEHIKALLL